MASMKILIIGQGGREHALAWKLRQSRRVREVFIAPGNAGTLAVGENVPIAATDLPRLLAFAKAQKIDLTVVGPEQPLVAGVVDLFQKEKLRIFGPSQVAAELEGSKAFCKHLLRQADVPTADYQTFSDPQRALIYLRGREDVPVVVKADGLASGKGVFVCHNRVEAIDAVNRIIDQREFGNAGRQIVIEERLDGEEASVLAITDGQTIITLPPAQDHKPAFDGDKGPNTGGMGAYCPAPLVKPADLHKIEEQVLVPVVHAMKRARRPFKGVLYAGLMMTNQGPKVLEFNVRFGDPECQPLLMRLKSDFCDLLLATVEGRLAELPPIAWDPRPSVCVVMASEGYPGNYTKGLPIRGLEDAAKVPDVQVFHAGTTVRDNKIVTDGGRVLGVTALGNTIAQAKLAAYTAVKAIRWDGAWCRKDIADKALAWETG
ncbi:MAG: phosphoribosylamine--glycine ligase [Pirellulales bacterium]|nr:phosphoribosylamine--glycine ligase [Pirellulales bacterium]